MSTLLKIEDLNVGFRTEDGVVQAVRGVDLTVDDGDVLAIVGESGSGKSVTALSVLGLHPTGRTTVSGRIEWNGENLVTASDERMRQVRGGEIAMIFQDPLSALNPVYTVGRQIMEMVRAHGDVSKAAARERAIEMLALVGIPQPKRRVDNYPHEFSGGMRQRAMIAMALSCEPKLVIADEPTTALDVTVQAQVLDLLVEVTQRQGAAVMLITHDLGVVAGMAKKVAVMYAGKVVEEATSDQLFDAPTHPYTIGLLRSLPRVDADGSEKLLPIGGQPPSMLSPPPGCAFHPRCPIAQSEAGCDTEVPSLHSQPVSIVTGAAGPASDRDHGVACWRRDEVPTLLGVVHS
ncbi:MAG: ABC transporter ATP-binding protein [Acidimicrobiales bacterium]